MKRFMTIIIALVIIFSIVSCSTPNYDTQTIQPIALEPNNRNDDDNNEKSEDDLIMNKDLSLRINNTLVDVIWLENDSVNALKELAKDNLIIEMKMYGGFEQVGSLGKTITSADTNIITSPGDIVLYSSNQIVIFYNSNSWSYTKLGHINLSKDELTFLLANGNVTITISLK